MEIPFDLFPKHLPFGRNRKSEAFYLGFGEHVIGKEVETAMKEATANTEIRIKEFTVAPQVNPEKGLPYHEWLIEFDVKPKQKSI